MADISEILPGKLYLSSLSATHHHPWLVERRVSHILSITFSMVLPRENIKHMQIKLLDDQLARISEHFEVATSFIHEAISNDGCVLVHCDAGVSRSSTLVLAYLIKHHQMSLTEAHKLVKSKRDLIAPNLGFLLQLQLYAIAQSVPSDDLSVILEEICSLGYDRTKVERIVREHNFATEPILESISSLERLDDW
eukprot:TRINITY_DN8987_c0_g1_i1.p1 TRINITY_DN8987_c0_g1~~TRINITY_DN8987_c0_g1_i1.p1  ORF type:complete len:194 (-),score=20.41 TRINITY_DN8987_c0_g1_i1:65-646(-)